MHGASSTVKPIVLLTDFGIQDPYVGILKGVILSLHPKGIFLDLGHEIEPQNVLQAGHVLEMSYPYFPKGSIFLCVVDPGVGTSRKILCARTRDYFFIGPDNGLLAPALFREKSVRIREVRNADYFLTKVPSATFQGRDVMAPVAARLSRAPKPEELFKALGPEIKNFRKLAVPAVLKTSRSRQGRILYFDRFGNAITNIRLSDAPGDFWQKARFYAGGKPLGRLSRTYASSSARLAVLWNSFNQLEIAAPNHSARERGKLKQGNPVRAELP